jgi:hypothetical protein
MDMEIALTQMQHNPDWIFCGNAAGDSEPENARNRQNCGRNL